MPDTVRQVVNSYPHFNSQSICSYGLTSSSTYVGRVCHAELRWLKPKIDDVFITSYPVKNEVDVQFFKFFSNLLYKNYSNFIHLDQTEDGFYYIRITNLSEIPSCVLLNICITSRIIVEFRSQLNRWAKLVVLGMHPSFAFAVLWTSNNRLDHKVSNPFTCNVVGHWPIHNSVSLKKLVIDGPDVKDRYSFVSKSYDCTPTNSIWGNCQDLRGLKGKTLRQFYNDWIAENMPSEKLL